MGSRRIYWKEMIFAVQVTQGIAMDSRRFLCSHSSKYSSYFPIQASMLHLRAKGCGGYLYIATFQKSLKRFKLQNQQISAANWSSASSISSCIGCSLQIFFCTCKQMLICFIFSDCVKLSSASAKSTKKPMNCSLALYLPLEFRMKQRTNWWAWIAWGLSGAGKPLWNALPEMCLLGWAPESNVQQFCEIRCGLLPVALPQALQHVVKVDSFFCEEKISCYERKQTWCRLSNRKIRAFKKDASIYHRGD